MVFLLYQESTHIGPSGFWVYDSLCDKVVKDWLDSWPHGKIVVLTIEHFRKTPMYQTFKDNGWAVP